MASSGSETIAPSASVWNVSDQAAWLPVAASGLRRPWLRQSSEVQVRVRGDDAIDDDLRHGRWYEALRGAVGPPPCEVDARDSVAGPAHRAGAQVPAANGQVELGSQPAVGAADDHWH